MGVATREAYGQILKDLAEDKNVVVLEADLGKATKSIEFKKYAPERYIELGIAECNMMGTAAGLATCGKIPFASTFAMFAAGRAFEQIRNSIAYPNLNVKVVATHAGITVGEDGGSHQCNEDIALMRSIPHMVVINPADAEEAKQAILAAKEYYGPVYIRLGRSATPDIHDQSYKFQIGKGEVLAEGNDVAIIATGLMVAKAIEAAKTLEEQGIKATVVNIATIKPLDNQLIVDIAKKTGKVVTVEEHSIIGGLGSAVSELLSEECPVKMKRIGINDEFGTSGSADVLLEKFNLTAAHIAEVVKSFNQ